LSSHSKNADNSRLLAVSGQQGRPYCAKYNYTVSQKTSPSFISRSFVKHCPILTIFGENIPEKIQL